MTQLKHVLILTIMILPMFALVPTLVASPNVALLSQEKVDTSLPAQFVEETLRVAVYAESNLTLPAYATGGVYTDYYQNVIDLLESAGYAVTAMTTQDILDHKLTVADYDAFVLPNQLPRERIVNHIKNYWLGGGGVLSFEASIGFCFYAGLIHSSLEGQFSLYPIDLGGMWTYSPFPVVGDIYDGINSTTRHPVTKSLEDDTLYPFVGNHTILEGVALPSLLGSAYLDLAYYKTQSTWTSIAGFDNPDRGGKIVFLTGNCSSFETWMEPVVGDSIDWLTPRPKARILYDLTHLPYYGVDSWDISYVQAATTQIDMRGFLVNRSYTFDKLYPPSTLSTEALQGYDVLIACDPSENFTAAEVAAVTDWVNAGGSILGIADHTLSNNQNMNYLLSNMDIGMNHSATGQNALVPSGVHVTHEGTTTMGCLAPGAVGTAGSAFSIWEDAIGVPVIGGDQHGSGRVILIADGAVMRDGRIGLYDNTQALINFANWLSAAKGDVLFYVENYDLSNPYEAPAVDALNDLEIPFYLTYTEFYLNLSLHSQDWSLVIIDSAWPGINPYLDDFSSYLDTGGDLIVSWHMMHVYQSDPLYSKVGFGYSANYPDSQPFYIWSPNHGIFNYPSDYGALNFTQGYDIGEEGDLMTVYANATALAGLTDTNQPGNATIVLGFNAHVLWNGYLIDQLTGDVDDSTYSDAHELWENEIGFMYFDRPTIDSPADVTYMETETGNEITWTPTADAGPWSYTFRVNGTIEESGSWTGVPLTFNIDGVNISITEYELTVFDRLGYSVSDSVTLNVTEYIAPGPSIPFDPT
ncbi:MAG: hypothetical protein ACFFBL_04045, partial [Promethearchaeota archaeon]